MNRDALDNTGLEVPITTRRNADYVMELEFDRPLDGTVNVVFSGADILPTATVTLSGRVATVLVAKASVNTVAAACRYLVTYTDPDGIITPCVGGVFRVID